MGRGTENCGAVGCRFETGNEGCPNNMTCGSAELPEHPMMIGSFALDKYEVTVGRFRRFVTAYAAPPPNGFRPAVGSGANPNAVNYTTSWLTGWDDSGGSAQNLPLTGATAATTQTNFALRLGACSSATWTDAPGANENKAINCVNWYEAFAFCIWDGGRLPTEAEWEFAAAGGDLNLLYPWGSAAPDCTYANYYTGSTYCTGLGGGVLDVGSMQKGNGRWDHADLAGNAGEWVFDWFGAYDAAQNNNYANTTTATNRVTRGGSWGIDAYTLRSAYRNYWTPISHSADLGFRCARTP
jgi:formylglycine-generating enzyme required for sulfatase activity